MFFLKYSLMIQRPAAKEIHNAARIANVETPANALMQQVYIYYNKY